VAWHDIFDGGFEPDEVRAYEQLLHNLHDVQNRLASMRMDRGTVEEIAADLEKWRDRLDPLVTDESNQVNGRVLQLPVRGHAMLPQLVVSHRDHERLEGTVTFGRWFMGGGMAAHGGAVTLMFDEALGNLAGLAAGGMTRTAYLKVDYRALTPIDVELTTHVWVERIEGRKLYLRGELRHGDVVCAEAEGLFLKLLPENGMGKRTT